MRAVQLLSMRVECTPGRDEEIMREGSLKGFWNNDMSA
jgi:hypothetical protein